LGDARFLIGGLLCPFFDKGLNLLNCRERVRQIEAKALAKIRKRLQEQGVTASDLL
jgi:hypothetical protein